MRGPLAGSTPGLVPFGWAHWKICLSTYFQNVLADAAHPRHRMYWYFEYSTRVRTLQNGQLSLLRCFNRHDRDSGMAKSPPPNSYCIYQVMADFFEVDVILLEATQRNRNAQYRAIRRWVSVTNIGHQVQDQLILIKHWDDNYEAVLGNRAVQNWGNLQNPNNRFRPQTFQLNPFLRRPVLEVDYCPWHPDPADPNTPTVPIDWFDPQWTRRRGWAPLIWPWEIFSAEGERDAVIFMPRLRPVANPQLQERHALGWMNRNWDNGARDPNINVANRPLGPLPRWFGVLACDGPQPNGTLEGI